MGDHRISWTIIAEFHGVTRKYPPCWLNFSSTICEGVDDRVVQFFRELYEAGMDVYNEQILEDHRREHAADIERSERAQLATLKAKYESESSPGSER